MSYRQDKHRRYISIMQKIEPKKSLIKRNILQYLDVRGITRYEFYKDSGVARGTLDNESGISEDGITKFIAYTKGEINVNWLVTGEGDMFVDEKHAEVRENFSRKTDPIMDEQHVPLYDIEAVAGLVPLFYDGKPETKDYIQIPHLPKCDGGVYVTGDSMYPLLKSGDIVLYKAIKDFKNGIFWGEMYLISIEIDGEEYISVKYIQKSDIEDNIKLVSYNHHHADKDIHISLIRALALVKASIRINSMR